MAPTAKTSARGSHYVHTPFAHGKAIALLIVTPGEKAKRGSYRGHFEMKRKERDNNSSGDSSALSWTLS